jgi:hypothetical protein
MGEPQEIVSDTREENGGSKEDWVRQRDGRQLDGRRE